MNSDSSDLPSADQAPMSVQSLHQAYLNLRLMFQALALIMLVLSGSVNVYFLRQVILVRKEVEERERFMDDYTRNILPSITNFVARLQSFARTNPDFVPVLTRYGIRTDTPLTGTGAGPGPGPGPGPGAGAAPGPR